MMVELDHALSRLVTGAKDLQRTGVAERLLLLADIHQKLFAHADEWVRVSCEAKGIALDSACSAEEVFVGPAAVARYLLLLSQSLQSIQQWGAPELPGPVVELAQGKKAVPVVPARGLFDSILFRGIWAEVRLGAENDGDDLFDERVRRGLDQNEPSHLSLVLGAGNISSICICDTLTKIFQEDAVVLLKMSPVNDYLTDIFSAVLSSLIRRGWVQIIKGDEVLAAAAVNHPLIHEVHITGSQQTHDRIVWGATPDEQQRRKLANDPRLKKRITSELGNVSPWIIVPGAYSERQLKYQAENICASIVNNAGFNCLTTRMLITSSKWAQRERFLDLIKAALRATVRRKAYYPGASERFERFSGMPAELDGKGTLPWMLLTDVNPKESPLLFAEESFVGLCAECTLPEENPDRFIEAAAEFANDRLYGTLCSAITIPTGFRKGHGAVVERVIEKMNYGSVCFNQWPGLAYGLMAPPWGAAPGGDLRDVRSGIGTVHNTAFLKGVEKTVMQGPLATFPKPVWFSSNRRARAISENLMALYEQPSVSGLPQLLMNAVQG